MALNKEFYLSYSKEWCQLKFDKVWNKKGSVKKKKTTRRRSRIFQVSLKGEDDKNFPWENFDRSMFLSC